MKITYIFQNSAKFEHCLPHKCDPQIVPEGCYIKRTMNGSCCGEGIICRKYTA